MAFLSIVYGRNKRVEEVLWKMINDLNTEKKLGEKFGLDIKISELEKIHKKT